MSNGEVYPENPAQSTDQTLISKYKTAVADAALLLDFAVANGVSGPNDRKLDDQLIGDIKRAQDLARKSELPGAEDRAKFQAAYRDLALFLRPVTAETVKATSEKFGVRSPLVSPFWPRPLAIVWSRKLSAWTILFVCVALLGQWFEIVYGALPQGGEQEVGTFPPFGQSLQFVLQILVPFTYGAIGASVYLLKACQAYIHLRQFDPLRIPEYYNRMILGGVAGGIIVLLINQVAGDGGTTIRFSAAALGFLAGYNNDLLFSAIERISAALLPKVGLQSIRQEKPTKADAATIEDVSLKDLLDRHKNATNDEEKKLYAGLIQKLQQRL